MDIKIRFNTKIAAESPWRMVTSAFRIPTLFTLAILLIPFQTAFGEWAVPQDLDAKMATLDASQQTFIETGAVFDYLPERQLIHELTRR